MGALHLLQGHPPLEAPRTGATGQACRDSTNTTSSLIKRHPSYGAARGGLYLEVARMRPYGISVWRLQISDVSSVPLSGQLKDRDLIRTVCVYIYTCVYIYMHIYIYRDIVLTWIASSL